MNHEVLYYLILENVMMANKAEGLSMDPTIQDGSIIIVEKLLFKVTGFKKKSKVIKAYQLLSIF